MARVRELQWVSNGDEVRDSAAPTRAAIDRSFRSAWRLIHDRFLCRPEQTSLPLQIAANDLTIHSRTGALTLRDVDAWIRSAGATRSRQRSSACRRSPLSDSPININVRRDRSGATPSTLWTLNTSGTPLPCSALAEYLTPMESLGTDAMFSGTLRWHLQGKQWWVDLGGSRFEQVSLDRLFEQHAHRLSGTAKIHLERCRIEPHNRRSDVSGSIRAENGLIGRSLLYSVHKHLEFDVRMPEDMIDSQRTMCPTIASRWGFA